MTQSQLIAGRWTLPVVESNDNGAVFMHVSVQVSEPGALDGIPVQASLMAQGQECEFVEDLGGGEYLYVSTGSTTAVTRRRYSSPSGADPDTCTVTIEGDSATFAVTVRDKDIPIV